MTDQNPRRVRSKVVIQLDLDEAHLAIAAAEIKRDQTEIERLRGVIARLNNEMQPKLLDPHQQAHGPARRAPFHHKKAKA